MGKVKTGDYDILDMYSGIDIELDLSKELEDAVGDAEFEMPYNEDDDPFKEFYKSYTKRQLT